jgi:hypothetical protein
MDAPAPDAPPPPPPADPAPEPAPPVQAESVAVDAPAPGEAPEEVHQANAVSSWTMVQPAPTNDYVKDVLHAIQSQSVSGNPALQSLA